MTMRKRIESDRAPCGCPSAPISTGTAPRYSQYNPSDCPGSRRGVFQQFGTDLLVPLIEPHVQYNDYAQYQTSGAPMSWNSMASTELDNIVTEEGYSKYNKDGLNVNSFSPLTPPQGVNMNEARQLHRAVIESQALQISPSLHRFVQAEEEDNVDVDENGNLYYACRGRHIPMLPAHFQSPTPSMVATIATKSGKPSSRGKSSSRSGRRSSRDERSSGYDNNNYVLATGGLFADQPWERASQVTMSEDMIEEDMFPFEEDQWN